MLNLNKIDSSNKKDKSDLEFAIGKAYDDKKNYELSIKYFESANEKRKKLVNYNFKSDEKLFKSIKNYFQNLDLNNIKKNKNSKKIIFIVGLPRSGTTLLEQILSAHHQVFGAGELDFLRQPRRSAALSDRFLFEIGDFTKVGLTGCISHQTLLTCFQGILAPVVIPVGGKAFTAAKVRNNVFVPDTFPEQ